MIMRNLGFTLGYIFIVTRRGGPNEERRLKQELEEIKNKEQKSHKDRIRRKQLESKIGGQIFTVDDLGLNFEVEVEEIKEVEKEGTEMRKIDNKIKTE